MNWGKNGLGEEFTWPKLVWPEAYETSELVDSDDGNLYDKNPGVNVDVNLKSTVGDKHLKSSWLNLKKKHLFISIYDTNIW